MYEESNNKVVIVGSMEKEICEAAQCDVEADVYEKGKKEGKMTLDTWMEEITRLSYVMALRALGDCNEKPGSIVTSIPQICWSDVNIGLRLDEKICNQLGEEGLNGKRVELSSVDDDVFCDKMFKGIIATLTVNPVFMGSCCRDGNLEHGAAIPGVEDGERFVRHIKKLRGSNNVYGIYLVNRQSQCRNPLKNYGELIVFVESLCNNFRMKLSEKVFAQAQEAGYMEVKYSWRKVIMNLAMLLQGSSIGTSVDEWMFFASEIMKNMEEMYDLSGLFGPRTYCSVVMGPCALKGSRNLMTERRTDNRLEGRKWRWLSEVVKKESFEVIDKKIKNMSEEELRINGFVKDMNNVVRHIMNGRVVGAVDYEHWLSKVPVIMQYVTNGWVKSQKVDIRQEWRIGYKYSCSQLKMDQFLITQLQEKKDAYKRWRGIMETHYE